MKIIITETGALKDLSIIDPKNGVNYISDFIGNTGALIDGQFELNEDKDVYACSQETFDWWDKVVSDNQELLYRINKLMDLHDEQEVMSALYGTGSDDLEDYAARANYALDDAFCK